MTNFILDEYNRLVTFEDRKAYCLTRQVKQPLHIANYLDWDYEKQNSHSNHELGE